MAAGTERKRGTELCRGVGLQASGRQEGPEQKSTWAQGWGPQGRRAVFTMVPVSTEMGLPHQHHLAACRKTVATQHMPAPGPGERTTAGESRVLISTQPKD